MCRCTLTWVPARPTPGAAYMVSSMSAIRRLSSSSKRSTGLARIRSRVSGNSNIGNRAMKCAFRLSACAVGRQRRAAEICQFFELRGPTVCRRDRVHKVCNGRGRVLAVKFITAELHVVRQRYLGMTSQCMRAVRRLLAGTALAGLMGLGGCSMMHSITHWHSAAKAKPSAPVAVEEPQTAGTEPEASPSAAPETVTDSIPAPAAAAPESDSNATTTVVENVGPELKASAPKSYV